MMPDVFLNCFQGDFWLFHIELNGFQPAFVNRVILCQSSDQVHSPDYAATIRSSLEVADIPLAR